MGTRHRILGGNASLCPLPPINTRSVCSSRVNTATTTTSPSSPNSRADGGVAHINSNSGRRTKSTFFPAAPTPQRTKQNKKNKITQHTTHNSTRARAPPSSAQHIHAQLHNRNDGPQNRPSPGPEPQSFGRSSRRPSARRPEVPSQAWHRRLARDQTLPEVDGSAVEEAAVRQARESFSPPAALHTRPGVKTDAEPES